METSANMTEEQGNPKARRGASLLEKSKQTQRQIKVLQTMLRESSKSPENSGKAIAGDEPVESDDSVESDVATKSSDSTTSDEDNASKKKTKKKLKLRKSKPKSKSKRSKPQSSAKASSKKHKSAKASSDSDSDSDSDDSLESDSDVELTRKQTSRRALEKQVRDLQTQLSQLQQQLNPSSLTSGQGPVMMAYNAAGYPVYTSNNYNGVPPMNASGASMNSAGSMSFRANQNAQRVMRGRPPPTTSRLLDNVPISRMLDCLDENYESDVGLGRGKKTKKQAVLEYKRVDQVWDSKIHNFKLQDTAKSASDSRFDKYVFHVRRTFDWEGKYRVTYVDIKSKLLRECLEDVIGKVKGVSLVDETPKLDPNLLFLYLGDFRKHLKDLGNVVPSGDTKKALKKNKLRLKTKVKHLKLLIEYLDTDYAAIKDDLYPMLKSGIITFDLLWALWKPGTLAFTPTYGCSNDPRLFKVDLSQVHQTLINGTYYYIEGKYFEYDGKRFGYGAYSEEIPEFQGTRKITSLACYPLQYHKEEAKVRADLIERGKKFVALGGVHYKSYQGMAFLKRKKQQVIKFNVQPSRIMVDPSIFRRINPNYQVSAVKPKDHDILSDDGLSDVSDDEVDDDCCHNCTSSDSNDKKKKKKYVTKVYRDKKGKICMAKIDKDLLEGGQSSDSMEVLLAKEAVEGTNNAEAAKEESETQVDDNIEETAIPDADVKEQETEKENENQTKADDNSEEEPQEFFTEEEYLLASPVVLGFAFAEKQWLEFSVSGITDINWNEKAWDSLVLDDGTKDLIKAMVVSRKYHAANTIDDVIQGKGKGLVTVLHGPPGTGKTLTAEGISELLKCPLYMVSAGELGTDSRYLEVELQKILDICHTWGAILLLDEADVFLEKRDMHNIHRNALVSIFLRQLEYFQGILFLTTNRVETFDEAFQSRIHVALRYDDLDMKAKRTIFRMFLERVKELGKLEVKPLTEEELNQLAKHDLNGREIKNVIGSAQDLAVNKNEVLSMRHIQQVLDVHTKFGRDLKGGRGYEDVMRSYC